MPIGPGKYDDLCTYVREESNAQGCIIIVIDGTRGSGFSCQVTDPLIALETADILENVVNEMRNDVKKNVN